MYFLYLFVPIISKSHTQIWKARILTEVRITQVTTNPNLLQNCVSKETFILLPDNLCSTIGEEDPVLPRHHAPITVLLLTIVEASICVCHRPVVVVRHPLVSRLVIVDARA